MLFLYQEFYNYFFIFEELINKYQNEPARSRKLWL